MRLQEVKTELEAMGTAQNRKVYARHGVRDEMFGVSYANLGKLCKKIRVDHELAQALWATGNHDAQVLATMIADPERTSNAELELWLADLDSYVLTDAFAKLAAKTAMAPQLMKRWIESPEEWVGRAGWTLVAVLAAGKNPSVEEGLYSDLLATVEARIHGSANRVKDAMNNALISMGLRGPELEKKALAAAKRIGKVEVDHGETGCKTSDAVAYIARAKARKQKRGK